MLKKIGTSIRSNSGETIGIPTDINKISVAKGKEGVFIYFKDFYGDDVEIDSNYKVTTKEDHNLQQEIDHEILEKTLSKLLKKYVDNGESITVHGKEIFLNDAMKFKTHSGYNVIIYGDNNEFIFEKDGQLRKHNIDMDQEIENKKIAEATIEKLHKYGREEYKRKLHKYFSDPSNNKSPSKTKFYWYNKDSNQIEVGQGKNMKVLDIHGKEIKLADCDPIGEDELIIKPKSSKKNKDTKNETSREVEKHEVKLSSSVNKIQPTLNSILSKNTNETTNLENITKENFTQVSNFFGSILLGNKPEEVNKILNTILNDPQTKLSFSEYTTGSDQILYIDIPNPKSKIKSLIFPLHQNKQQLAAWYPDRFEIKDKKLVTK